MFRSSNQICWPLSPQDAALTLNIADVWHVRNGMLWAIPWEKVCFLACVSAGSYPVKRHCLEAYKQQKLHATKQVMSELSCQWCLAGIAPTGNSFPMGRQYMFTVRADSDRGAYEHLVDALWDVRWCLLQTTPGMCVSSKILIAHFVVSHVGVRSPEEHMASRHLELLTKLGCCMSERMPCRIGGHCNTSQQTRWCIRDHEDRCGKTLRFILMTMILYQILKTSLMLRDGCTFSSTSPMQM